MSDKNWYSKNEIVELTQISINTLNLWIKKNKSSEKEIKIINKIKYFSVDYIKKIFVKHNRIDLVLFFTGNENGKSSQNEEKQANTNHNNLEELIQAKNEHILSLEREIKTKDDELKAKNEQITKLQTILENQQVLAKDLQTKISNQNLILENEEIKTKRKKFLGIF